jgi:hypothetical protein
MAERALTSQADLDDKLADAEIDQSRTGMMLAFTLTLIALVSAITFFALGNTVAGAVLLGLPVAMLVRSFLGR